MTTLSARIRRLATLVVIGTLPVFAPAQENSTPAEVIPGEPIPLPLPFARSSSQMVMELGYIPLLQTVVPLEPAPATVIALGTRVTLRPSADFGPVTDLKWYRNGAVIATDQPELSFVASQDTSGYYSATFSGVPYIPGTSPLQIQVGVADRHRIVNQSTRVTISPSSPTATFGFVIQPPAAGSVNGQLILLRVIGPALGSFGVAQPLPDPVYTLRNAAGVDRTPAQVFTTDVINGKTAEQRYREYVDRQSLIVGAFPVVSDLQAAPAPRNLADATNLRAGAYTMTVSSASGATGEVLVEIYEVWQEPNATTASN